MLRPDNNETMRRKDFHNWYIPNCYMYKKLVNVRPAFKLFFTT